VAVVSGVEKLLLFFFKPRLPPGQRLSSKTGCASFLAFKNLAQRRHVYICTTPLYSISISNQIRWISISCAQTKKSEEKKSHQQEINARS
jgi:hypothetical protein